MLLLNFIKNIVLPNDNMLSVGTALKKIKSQLWTKNVGILFFVFVYQEMLYNATLKFQYKRSTFLFEILSLVRTTILPQFW